MLISIISSTAGFKHICFKSVFAKTKHFQGQRNFKTKHKNTTFIEFIVKEEKITLALTRVAFFSLQKFSFSVFRKHLWITTPRHITLCVFIPHCSCFTGISSLKSCSLIFKAPFSFPVIWSQCCTNLFTWNKSKSANHWYTVTKDVIFLKITLKKKVTSSQAVIEEICTRGNFTRTGWNFYMER